jgi:methionine sulfoxide reductase heme-binding subunit
MVSSLKPLVFLSALLPLAVLVFQVLTGRTSANPAEDIILTTGLWAFRFLLATLAITPLRRLTGWNRLIQYRRMLGLFAFFYASLHFLAYMAFDRVFDASEIAADVAKRPFITMGMVAFAAMVPLAVTSTRGWIRRLGRHWVTLHRLVYLSGIAAAVHFLWKVKVVIGEPVYYAILLAVLLGARVFWARRRVPARPGAGV